jgi:Flp pilus assembly protein TadG
LVEFALVGSMVTLIFLALLQLAIDFHVRNVLAACAADGARYAANADISSPAQGALRAEQLVRQDLGSVVRLVQVRGATLADDGQPVEIVRMSVRLPTVFGLLPALPVTVEGQSLQEPR